MTPLFPPQSRQRRDRRVRVLIYHATSEWTGTGRAAATLGRLLDASGARVTASVRAEGAVEERFAIEGLDIVTIDREASVVAEAARLRKVIRDYFIEVVIVTSAFEHRVASVAMRMAGRGAVLRRLQSGERVSGGVADRLSARLASTGWLFASDGERRSGRVPALALGGAVVPLGVSTSHHDVVQPVPRSAFSFAGGGPTLVCVGDPSVRESATPLLRAVHLLLPRHAALRLLFVGRGTEDDDLRMHAAALGITRAVRFLGERRDQLGIMRSADLGFVLAGGDDAAWACLDFMALRVPLISPASAVAQEYVADGITGVLLDRDDGPESAAAMATLIARPNDRRRMGDAAHSRVAREYPESRMSDAIVRIVERARERETWTS